MPFAVPLCVGLRIILSGAKYTERLRRVSIAQAPPCTHNMFFINSDCVIWEKGVVILLAYIVPSLIFVIARCARALTDSHRP